MSESARSDPGKLIISDIANRFAITMFVPPLSFTEATNTPDWISPGMWSIHLQEKIAPDTGQTAIQSVIYEAPHSRELSEDQIVIGHTRIQVEIARHLGRLPLASSGWIKRVQAAQEATKKEAA